MPENPRGGRDPFPHTVFVYGTLKQGWALAHLLDGQHFLGQASTLPEFRLYGLAGGAYPGLVRVPDPPTDGLAVRGELWAVTTTRLAILDEVEGVADGEYARLPVPLQPPFQNAAAEAYHYLKPVAGLPDLGAQW